MIFLIDYERASGRLIELRAFRDDQGGLAAREKLELEIRLNREGVKREIVLIDAADEAALRKTHRRYFESLTELVRKPRIA